MVFLMNLATCFGYLAAVANELGADLGEIANNNLKKLADRQARNVLGGSGDNR